MPSTANTVNEYMDQLPLDRKEAIAILRKTINKNLPKGFEECISYGSIGYVVPHSIYPAGYHCDPKLPLPFMNIANQKTGISLHHLGLYAHKPLLDWFVAEYAKLVTTKLDMGKGCVRFKKIDQIPYDLIGQLVTKISVKAFIQIMEENFVPKK